MDTDGKKIVYGSERNGKWSIYQAKRKRESQEPFFFASTLIEEKPFISNEEDNYLAKFSPDGKKVAYVANRRFIKVRDIASGKEVDLLTDQDLFHMRDGDKYFSWSPDSKWLLVDWSKTLSNSEVLLMAADGSKRINLTESGYYDSRPKWVNDGKQMIWFSNRNGLKSYATSGQSQRDVYSMFFTQEVWDEFNMSKEDFELMESIEEELEKDKEEEKSKRKSKRRSRKSQRRRY